MPKRVKTALYLDHSQVKALKSISSKTGIPLSKLVRDGVDMVIRSHRKKRR